MNRPRVAVVILNFNTRKLLEDFLPFTLQHNSYGAEIIIADNASTDDSIAFLQKQYPQLRVIRNAFNGGYARGYNEALSQVDADIFVLLNSDIEVTAKWLEPVIELMAQDETIAACQPKIRSWKERTLFEYAGAAGGFIDAYGYPFCRGRIFFDCEEDLQQYDDVAEVFWASGACMFVRAEAFREAGGFDEDFFAHMEEVDLCWRFKNHGYRIMVQPKSLVFHVGGGTLSKQNPFKMYLNFRNGLMMLFKNLKTREILWRLSVRLLLDGVAGIRALLIGSTADLKAILKAHFYFHSHLPTLLAKRRVARKYIGKRNPTGILKGSVVFQYFILGKKLFSKLRFR